MNKTIALLFIGLVLGINIYLCWRLWRITPGMWAVKAGVVAAYLLWMALFFVSFLRIERLPVGLAQTVYNVGNPWLIFFLYLLIAFLLTGLARICHFIPPAFFKDSLAGLCSIVGGVVLLMAIGGIHYHHKYREELTIHTDKPLDKPVSRGELILGKYLGAVVAGWSSLLFFYALWVVSATLRGGDWCSACFFQAFALHALFMALATAAALCGSFLLTPSASTTLLAVLLPAMFFFGRRLPDYAQNVSGFMRVLVKISYWALPHVEFFDMRQRLVHGWGSVDTAVFLAVVGYGLAYVVALLALAHVLFRRKRL